MKQTIDTPTTPTPEQNEQPKLRLMVTRHTERLPDGTLSPEGQAQARRKGEKVKESGAEVFKAYVSDHKSGRAIETGQTISSSSQIASEHSGKQYRTHKVPDIQYDILKPDLSKLVAKASDMINTATLQDLGMSTERDDQGKLKIEFESLSADEQARIAPIRAKNQRVGINFVMQNDAAVDRMASGLAHQLAHELKLSGDILRCGIALKSRLKEMLCLTR